MTPQVKLIITSNMSKEMTYTYTEPMECTVGASHRLRYPTAGHRGKGYFRHHCVFEIEPPHIWLQDLDSKNGTFVNGLRITSSPDMYELRDGDEVGVCHYVIEVQVDGNEVIDDLIQATQSDMVWTP